MKCKFLMCSNRRGVRGEIQPNRTSGKRSFTAGESGFTLMELLIVISIILILMLVAIPTAGKIRKHANETFGAKVAADDSGSRIDV